MLLSIYSTDFVSLFIPLIAILITRVLWVRDQKSSKNRFHFVKRQWRDSLTLSNPVTDLVAKGYKIYKKAQVPFTVSYWGQYYTVLPSKYLYEIRNANKHHLSFFENIPDDGLRGYQRLKCSNALVEAGWLPRYLICLANYLSARCTDVFINEMDFAFNKELGDCSVKCLSNIALRTVASVMVGSDLCRNEAFIEAAQNYFRNNMTTGIIALKLPLGPLRNILLWPLYMYHQRRLLKSIDLVEPVIRKRLDEKDRGIDDPSRVDAIAFQLKMLDEFPLNENGVLSPTRRLSSELLQTLWAAGSSPGSTICQMVFLIQQYRQYLEPLQQEANAAIEKYGWSEKITHHLPLQDSFLRETNRLFPLFSLNCTRTISSKPFTFSDGLTFYPGDRIGFPAAAVQSDADLFDDPSTFDGFRFVKLAAKNARNDHGVNKWAATHSSLSNLVFGYGNHACPGRFLAVRLIKSVFTKLLVDYDVLWDQNGCQPLETVHIEGITWPDPDRKITLRRRNVTKSIDAVSGLEPIL